MSSMILLSSSSFFLHSYLTHKLSTADYTPAQFSYALVHDYTDALIIEEATQPVGSKKWFLAIKKLAHYQSSAAYKLGNWYKIKALSTQEAADGENSFHAIMWLKQSISLGGNPARLSLAQFYYRHGFFKLTESLIDNDWLSYTDADLSHALLSLKLKFAIYVGDINKIQTLLKDIDRPLGIELQALLADMVTYGVVEQQWLAHIGQNITSAKNNGEDKKSLQATQAVKQCATSLQLFATSIEHLRHTETLINTFNQKQPISNFVCLDKPQYLSKRFINCNNAPSAAIQCDESKWLAVTKKVTSRHIGLLLEEGGANVHLGILYLSQSDDDNIFAHEVSHLLGFVDEYPLPNTHKICQNIQDKRFSHNIAVLPRTFKGELKEVRKTVLSRIPWADEISPNTRILSEVKTDGKNKLWQLATPKNSSDKVGVYLSETCANNTNDTETITSSNLKNYSAYKPLFTQTQLRYNKSKFPTLYQTMLIKRPAAYLMPSFHYNIALSLFQQGNIDSAKFWLTKAADYEDDPQLKSIILKGDF